MLDIEQIRLDPAALDHALARRGHGPAAHVILETDRRHRTAIGECERMQERRNQAAAEIGAARKAGDPAEAERMTEEARRIKGELPALEAARDALAAEMLRLHLALPNMPAADVPEGTDATGNVMMRAEGIDPGPFEGRAREHYEIGEALGMMDFETAARLSGSRFTVLRGGLARLHRALGQFMLDLHTGEHGYEETDVPLLVGDEAMTGTAQLPKFADDQFKTTDGRWLIPTAEVPLTNMLAEGLWKGRALVPEDLPVRVAALTPCFRAEAGAAGRDVRGVLRQHQFHKVEMVSIAAPERSAEEHERMTQCAEEVLKRLGLRFRTVLLCAGDMGFAARKTYDIEVWLPGQRAFREISSCSNCGDFQARRIGIRYRPKDGRVGRIFAHTLNGSGTAVGRALVAVMETYQQADGSVTVPDVLLPYMGGLRSIGVATLRRGRATIAP